MTDDKTAGPAAIGPGHTKEDFMTHTLVAHATPLVAGDPRPVEKAVIDDILDNFGPLKFLTISFEPVGGGLRWYHAWTAGGDQLGDEIDDIALARGLDTADYTTITDRHTETTYRGKVRIQACDLPPVRADVDLSHGDDDPQRRVKLRQFAAHMADAFPDRYMRPAPGMPLPWLGVGPHLHCRRFA